MGTTRWGKGNLGTVGNTPPPQIPRPPQFPQDYLPCLLFSVAVSGCLTPHNRDKSLQKETANKSALQMGKLSPGLRQEL